MTSKRTDVQHGLLVQDVTLAVPARKTSRWILSLYCANKTRSPADETAEFALGPVVNDPALTDLFRLLAGKEIGGDNAELVQKAVWEITDEDGLTPETRELLVAFPAVTE